MLVRVLVFWSLQLLLDGLGKAVEIPQYDFVTSARLPTTTTVQRADVILFDGILAFVRVSMHPLGLHTFTRSLECSTHTTCAICST
jgi:hypothetical protein